MTSPKAELSNSSAPAEEGELSINQGLQAYQPNSFLC